jgi:D-alanyl-D-alanine carboxypeptidase/D-alanyl-D-alanine-endopeptidase (penicillin-binding protein 4)
MAGAVLAQSLPAPIESALAHARIPRESVSLLVVPAEANPAAPARLSHRAGSTMNPASVMKLVTTYAALDLLGPAYVWSTPVYLDAGVQDGTLQGNVFIQGQGDPKLVLERLWLLLRRLQGLGIQTIAGDVVLDRSAFDIPAIDPASFDGEPLRAYNAAPDALLINYKSVAMTFTPHAASRSASVQLDPPLYGVQMQTSVPLGATARGAECDDYRSALQADYSQPQRIRFLGYYPAACGPKTWSVAYADPDSYALRALQGLWLEMGGKIQGSVRYGSLPASLAQASPSFEITSPTLSDIIRDINKYSNNVMAQQLFLTLGRARPEWALEPQTTELPSDPSTGAGSFKAARAVVRQWWKTRISPHDLPVLDNGAGLSRHERISAQGLALLLQAAYRSPWMPEFISALPIVGIDGTLQHHKTPASAHLKSGSLVNVLARAGYVDAASGKRYILVALINHPLASSPGARAVVDALLDWTAKDL